MMRTISTSSVAVEVPPPWYRREWLWGLLLILLVILAYTPIWQPGFIWDDDIMLTANPCIVGPLGLKEIWTTNAADICPLTITTLWMEHALWGLAPLPYHLVNIVMHGACAVLLWRVLRSLQVPGAWLGAALWALHPVQVESVAWIAEMKNTESGLFFLLSILFFVKHLTGIAADPAKNASGTGWDYGLSLLFAALAMASKSSTVVLPVLFCLCAWWIDGRWHWRNVTRVIPILLMSVAASVLAVWTQTLQPGIQADPQWVRPWPQRLATAGDAVWFYLGKQLWPHPLITVYPRWQIDAGQWISYLPLAVVILLLLILWLFRNVPWICACFFAFAYFLAALLPVLGLIDPFISRYSLVFHHFQYLASMGPLALAGTGLARALHIVFRNRLTPTCPTKPWQSWIRPQWTVLPAVLPLVLGVVSWQRTWDYRSEEILWTDTVAKNPDCWLGHYNIGNALAQKGQIDEAITEYRRSLEIYPNYAQARTNLGNALFKKGHLDEAIAQYQKSLQINPNLAVAHANLGNALFQKRQPDPAIEQYQLAVKADPNYAQAHGNLGVALFLKGELDEAIAQYQKALDINPNYAEVRTNLGNALLQKGQLDEAIKQYQTAVKSSPNYALAHANLGVALLQRGELNHAITEFQEALRLNPSLSPVRERLARAQQALLKEGSASGEVRGEK
jgi:tetratricopeptide (TPR) repeat protein